MPVLSVGIDVAESRKGIDLVALDAGRATVAAYAGRTVDEIARLVLETLRPDVVCIDSPSQWAPPGRRREAERSLTRRGINLFTTPSELRARAFHGWMRQGFGIYQALGSVYPRYRGGAVRGTAAEYYPHLSSVALRGYIGDIRKKLEFRRAVLEEHGIAVAELRGQDQVDAALGALTGLIALEGGHTWVGLDEDALLVPLRDLPDRFVRIQSIGEMAIPASLGGRSRRSCQRPPCECGCGVEGPGRFRPGHDAKLRSRLRKAADIGDGEAAAELARRGWH